MRCDMMRYDAIWCDMMRCVFCVCVHRIAGIRLDIGLAASIRHAQLQAAASDGGGGGGGCGGGGGGGSTGSPSWEEIVQDRSAYYLALNNKRATPHRM